MRREVQTVAVPVFQFGIYSENDLSFFAGPDFDFGGRVHTNENIYLAQDGSATLTLRDVVTAVGEVVRTHLANGLSIATSGHRGYVSARAHRRHQPDIPAPELRCTRAATAAAAPRKAASTVDQRAAEHRCRPWAACPTMVLQATNTRQRTRPGPASRPASTRTGIRNGATGARRLDLPLVSDGAAPIDLIRRPSLLAPDTQAVLDQRFFSMASVRILLSDRASDITSLPTVTAAPAGRPGAPGERRGLPGQPERARRRGDAG